MKKTKLKTKSKVHVAVITTLAAAALVGIAASAVAGFVTIRHKKLALERSLHAYPYLSLGYMPGYVPGYIPGSVPGYSVPGYVPGYGTFVPLSTSDFIKEHAKWLHGIKSKLGL